MKVHLLFPSSRFFNFTIKLFFTLAMIIIAPPLCVLAQSLEEAYDPCATEPDSLPENTDFLLCPEPCSEGYCFEDPEDNEGIPTNGLVEDKWIEISGVYRITRNAEFRNCYFKMLPGAQILIEPAHEANPEIAFKNCEFWGCIEMWYGIHIDASAVTKLNFTFNSCKIRDAYIASNIYEGKKYYYDLQENYFSNNWVGISNRRQNGTATNALFVHNVFTNPAQLKGRTGYMTGLPMIGYPRAWAGMRYIETTVTVGTAPTLTTPNTTNSFLYLANGIIADKTWLWSIYNHFQGIEPTNGFGIWVIDNGAEVLHNSFIFGGKYNIFTQGANLKVTDFCWFQKITQYYIWCEKNTNAEQIIIKDNIFDVSSCKGNSAIYVQRP